MSNQVGGSVVWNLDVDDSKLTQGLSDAKKNVKNTASDIDKTLDKTSKGISSSFDDALKGSKAIATGIGVIGTAAVGAIGFGVKMAAEIETARQGFTTLLGSAKLADEAIAQIKKDAVTTPFEFSGLVRANQLLTSVTKNAPQSERMLLNVGKALSAAGKGGAELDNVIVNLQQIANTGHITEMDIRQFGFAGINILELLADHYGVTKEKAGEMVKESKNAFTDLEAAFAKAGENGGKFSRAFIDQAGTATQLWSNFKDVISQTAGEIVTQTGIFDAFKKALGGVVDTLQKFQPDIIDSIKGLMQFLNEYGIIVAGVIAGALTPALIGIATAIMTTVIPAFIALLPFIVVGGLIGTAIWAIVKLVQNWGDIMKFLGDVIVKVGSVIVGAFNSLKEKVVGIWKSIVTFFKDLGSTIVDAITAPFKSAYDSITNVAQKIKDAMDKINPFHRNSPSLVDNVMKGIGVIKDEFSSIGDIAYDPKAFPEVSNLIKPNDYQGMGSGKSSPTITINIAKMSSQMDVDALGRQLGYKLALVA